MPSTPVPNAAESGWPSRTTIGGALVGTGIGFACGTSGPLVLLAVGPGIMAGPSMAGIAVLLAVLVGVLSAILAVGGLILGYRVGAFATAFVTAAAIVLGAIGGAMYADREPSEAARSGPAASPTMSATAAASSAAVAPPSAAATAAGSAEPTPAGPMPPPGPILLTLHVRNEVGFDTVVAVVRGADPIGKPWGLTESGVSVACLRLSPGERAVVLASAIGAVPAVARGVLYEAWPGDIDPVRWIDIDASGAGIGGVGRPVWSDAVPDPCRFGDDLPG